MLSDQQKQVEKELLKTKSQLYETNYKNSKLKQKYEAALQTISHK